MKFRRPRLVAALVAAAALGVAGLTASGAVEPSAPAGIAPGVYTITGQFYDLEVDSFAIRLSTCTVDGATLTGVQIVETARQSATSSAHMVENLGRLMSKYCVEAGVLYINPDVAAEYSLLRQFEVNA